MSAGAANVAAVAAGAAVLGVVLLVGAAARSGTAVRSIAAAGTAEPGAPCRRPSTRLVQWMVPVAAVAAGSLLLGLAPATLIGLGVAVLGGHRRRAAIAAERRAAEVALPDAVEVLVLSIHAGRSPAQAVRDLVGRAPPALRPAFAAVELRLHRGHGLADALEELPRLVGPAAHELVAAVATADREGLPLAPMLDRLAADARAHRRRHGEAAARRLPVRLSFPLVLCTLPAFVLLAIAPAVLGALSTLGDSIP